MGEFLNTQRQVADVHSFFFHYAAAIFLGKRPCAFSETRRPTCDDDRGTSVGDRLSSTYFY
jgi:hypothetical protein